MRLFLSIVLLILSFAPAQAQNYPSYSEIYVNDFAGVLDDDQRKRLRSTLQELKEKRGIEFTVVTLNTLQDHNYSGAIEPFATGLFNSWGVGDASKNDGVMLLAVIQDRVMRIEVGSGYGTSMNGPMQRVIDGTILPQFRDGNYPEGLFSGVEEAIYQITGAYPGDYDAPQYEQIAKRGWRWAEGLISGLGAFAWAVLAPIGFGLWRVWKFISRRRPRKCPNDGTWMIWLGEKDDDAHLIKGQIREEGLKSADYDVWLCPACDHSHVIRHGAWFSSYSKCPRCTFHTLQTETTVLTSPTTSSTGKAKDDYHCLNCDESWSATRTLAKISKSSSSSSSSGGFGGGSSSGGGASGSW